MARPKRAAPVSRARVAEMFERFSAFPVKWSRPGLDTVRVGKGYCTGINLDGSLKIVDELNGGHRAIKQEFVKVKVRVKGPRATREEWQAWTDEHTAAVIEWRASLDKTVDPEEGAPA